MRSVRRDARAAMTGGRWYVRALRGLRPDRNPLRRTSDRVQTYLLAGLFVAAAAGAPFAAQAASQAAHAAALRAQQVQLAASHQVRAVLTQTATSTVDGNVVLAEVPAQAMWTSVTGVKRSGEVVAPTGSPKGTAVTIWTLANGDLTSPPLQPSQVTGQADLASVSAIIGIGLFYL